MIRGVADRDVDGRVDPPRARHVVTARAVDDACAFARDDDLVERGVVRAATSGARTWAPLDDATTRALREQIAIGIARLIVG